MKETSMYKNQYQTGATLIEGLVALFIFSLGALGLAAMQLTSLVSSGDSQQRSVVIWKAQEMADRIRANKAAAQVYIDAIGKSALTTIGVDDSNDVVACEQTQAFVAPTNMCADSVSSQGSCSTNEQIVDFDIWDVFCNPNGGLAAANSGLGVSGLEVVLFQNDPAVVGNDDMVLVLEWVSREAEANTEIATTVMVETDLCGLQDDFDVASSLDVYCLRFAL